MKGLAVLKGWMAGRTVSLVLVGRYACFQTAILRILRRILVNLRKLAVDAVRPRGRAKVVRAWVRCKSCSEGPVLWLRLRGVPLVWRCISKKT